MSKPDESNDFEFDNAPEHVKNQRWIEKFFRRHWRLILRANTFRIVVAVLAILLGLWIERMVNPNNNDVTVIQQDPTLKNPSPIVALEESTIDNTSDSIDIITQDDINDTSTLYTAQNICDRNKIEYWNCYSRIKEDQDTLFSIYIYTIPKGYEIIIDSCVTTYKTPETLLLPPNSYNLRLVLNNDTIVKPIYVKKDTVFDYNLKGYHDHEAYIP